MLGKGRPQRADKCCDEAITKIAEGDKSALSVIYSAYGKLISAAAYQITRDPHAAEDVLQDVMVAVAEKACKYRRGTNPRAWIMAITRNIAINRQRLFDNDRTLPLDAAPPAAEEDALPAVIMEDALSTLSGEERFLLYGRLYAGLDHGELGRLFGISRKAASARYNRALKKLREYYKER